MLSLQLPLVSFQEKSETAKEKLVQLVTEQLPSEDEGQKDKADKDDSNQALKNTSFQVIDRCYHCMYIGGPVEKDHCSRTINVYSFHVTYIYMILCLFSLIFFI